MPAEVFRKEVETLRHILAAERHCRRRLMIAVPLDLVLQISLILHLCGALIHGARNFLSRG